MGTVYYACAAQEHFDSTPRLWYSNAMLLQTFVQLNILFMAAPALAGWVISPIAHPMLAQAAQVICLPLARQNEATPQAEKRHAPKPAAQHPVAVCPLAIADNFATTSSLPASLAFTEAVVNPFDPFPQTARAP